MVDVLSVLYHTTQNALNRPRDTPVLPNTQIKTRRETGLVPETPGTGLQGKKVSGKQGNIPDNWIFRTISACLSGLEKAFLEKKGVRKNVLPLSNSQNGNGERFGEQGLGRKTTLA